MKKKISVTLLFVFVFSLTFAACGNESEAFEPSLPMSTGSDICVHYYVGGQTTEYIIQASEAKKVAEWVSSLGTEHRKFAEGETPGDCDGGKVYSFEAESGSFSYVMNGEEENYIVSGEEWYYVKSPSDPAVILKMEEVKYDLKPMIKVDGNIYLDTGKESTITGRCGVMDGKITSSVEGWEKPEDNNQSNFGADYEYQRVDENHIDVVINGKWITFVKEGYEEQVSEQTETLFVRNYFNDKENKALSGADGDAILNILNSVTEWVESTSDCLNDCIITINGKEIAYHSDCGTFNDGGYGKSFTVSEEEREKINEILEKYVDLGFEE